MTDRIKSSTPARWEAPTDKQVNSACLSYNHAFGLMTETEQHRMKFVAREWLHAWRKEMPLATRPDDAEVLRLRETEAALRAEVERLVAAGGAVLYHDERGQGVGYAEAMDALEAAVDHARAALGDKEASHDR